MDAIKKIDSLGRIVIPSDIRNTLGMSPNDSIEMTIKDNQLILTKHQQTCSMCGGTNDLITFEQLILCKDCLLKLQQINL